MATTRDLAMSALNENNAAPREPEINLTINAEPVKVVPQQYVIFKLVNESMNKFNLDGICHDIMNPATGKVETMRLLRGATSIWTTDLTELLKDKSYVNKNRISVKFQGGIARISTSAKNQLEFLRRHKDNVGDKRSGSGKYDFYEYNAAEIQKRKHDEAMKRVKMISMVTMLEDKKVEKLALFLGVKPYEDEIGLPRTIESFKTELMLIADKKPNEIEKYINSPEVEVSYMVRKALIDTKIDLGNGMATWTSGGGFICKIPKSERALPYLTEFALQQTDDGRAFKEKLESIT